MTRVAAIALVAAACQGPPDGVGSSSPDAVVCEGDTVIAGAPALPGNVVFLMGDGVGPEHLRAGAIARGAPLALATELDGPVYVNTDSLTTDRTKDPDTAPTDSAAAATALASGVRTLNGKVGVDADDNPVEVFGELARADGKAVGVVTTTFVYDASPAAFIAHAADRDVSADVVTSALDGVRPDVWLGAGQEVFDDDGGALTAAAEDAGYTIVRTAEQLAAWTPSAGLPLLGLFPTADAPVPGVYDWGLTPVVLRTAASEDPRLPAMTARALDALAGDPDGFVLFVENEHTDTLGHVSLTVTQTAVDGIPPEVAELDAALEVALDWIAVNSSFDETLVVVGADHETAGYTFDGFDPSTATFPDAPLHTRRPVGFYARGPGAENLPGLCRTSDVFLLLTGRLAAP